MKILILLLILAAFSRKDSMFETKMLVLGLPPSEESSEFQGEHGRIRVREPIGCHA